MVEKSIIILVDGMRPDAIAACGTAEADALVASGAVPITATTVMPSITLPCHISLFHSVPPTRHGTVTNTYTPQVRPVKSLCEVLHNAGKACASFYNWEQLRDIALPGCLDYSNYISQYIYPNTDTRVTDAMLEYTEKYSPDFVFLYMGETDEAGHDDGWMGEKYLKTLANAWDCIGRVARATEGKYNLFITADHGGHDRCHGTDMPEDMNIPIFVRSADSLPVRTDHVNIMDLAPSVTALAGLAADRDWEGSALIQATR